MADKILLQKTTKKKELSEEALEMPRPAQVIKQPEKTIDLNPKQKKDNPLESNSISFSPDTGNSLERKQLRTELEQSLASKRGKYDPEKTGKRGKTTSTKIANYESYEVSSTVLDRVINWLAGVIKKFEQMFLAKLENQPEPPVVVQEAETDEEDELYTYENLIKKKKKLK